MSSFAKGFGGCLGVFAAVCCVGVGGCVFMVFIASRVEIDSPADTPVPVVVEQADKKPSEHAQPIIAKPEPPALPKWSTRTSKDQLTDAVIETASLESTNTVDLSFPYNGEQRGRLTLRNTAGNYEVSCSRDLLSPEAQRQMSGLMTCFSNRNFQGRQAIKLKQFFCSSHDFRS